MHALILFSCLLVSNFFHHQPVVYVLGKLEYNICYRIKSNKNFEASVHHHKYGCTFALVKVAVVIH